MKVPYIYEFILLVSRLPELEIFMPRRGIEPQWIEQRTTEVQLNN